MTQAVNKRQSVPSYIRMSCIQAALDFERDLARRGTIPNTDRLPDIRFRSAFEFFGAVLLALSAAGMSLLGNYLVFNVILHWSS